MMTVQTSVTYDPQNSKESLEAAIQALQAAADGAPAGTVFHNRTVTLVDQLKALKADFASRRVDGA